MRAPPIQARAPPGRIGEGEGEKRNGRTAPRLPPRPANHQRLFRHEKGTDSAAAPALLGAHIQAAKGGSGLPRPRAAGGKKGPRALMRGAARGAIARRPRGGGRGGKGEEAEGRREAGRGEAAGIGA